MEHKLLIEVVSLVEEHRVQAHRLSSWSMQALEHLGFCSCSVVLVVVAHGISCPEACGPSRIRD